MGQLFSQDEHCPFRSTLCLQEYRKSTKNFKRFPDIPFRDSEVTLPATLYQKPLIYLRKLLSLQVPHQTTYIFHE